jgi:hypothetical protein
MRILKMRCKFCDHWNRVPVSKVLVEQDSPEPKVKVFIRCWNNGVFGGVW